MIEQPPVGPLPTTDDDDNDAKVEEEEVDRQFLVRVILSTSEIAF